MGKKVHFERQQGMGRRLEQMQRKEGGRLLQMLYKKKNSEKNRNTKEENRKRWWFSARRRSEKSRSFMSSGTSQGIVVFLVDVSLKTASCVDSLVPYRRYAHTSSRAVIGFLS